MHKVINSSHVVSSASNWHGTLQLTYAHNGAMTQVINSRVQAPLKVQRPFYPEGVGVCHSVILHTAGGVVGSDRLSLDIHLQPQSHALITTAAANKIYRTNGQEAQQTITVTLDPNTCLEWLPQETIVFNQAIYHQKMRIELAPGAIWMGWEMNRFGRTARGERFVQGHWRSHTEVWQGDRPLWLDRQWLPGSEEIWHSPHGLAAAPVVGSFAFVGQAIDPEIVTVARDLWLSQVKQQGQAAGETGVTRLMAGMLCRYRGHSTSEARRWFLAVWQGLRQQYLNRPAHISRIWQL